MGKFLIYNAFMIFLGIIHPAVLRPGRLDKVLYVGLPTAAYTEDTVRTVTKVINTYCRCLNISFSRFIILKGHFNILRTITKLTQSYCVPQHIIL